MPLDNPNWKGLWVDDERPLPEGYAEAGWTTARSFHEAIFKLEMFEFDAVSLDHDLGPDSTYGTKEMSGYDVLMWMLYRKHEGKHTPKNVYVHTANAARAGMMKELVQDYLED